MAKCIIIDMEDGTGVVVRRTLETATEDMLTDHERAINFLYDKVKKLNKPAVSKRESIEREALLIDFQTWLQKNVHLVLRLDEKQLADEYIKSINGC